MTRPLRFQRSRKKGWRKPAGGICVDRSTRWGNFAANWEVTGRPEAVRQFRKWLMGTPEGRVRLEEGRRILKNHPLGCYCPPGEPCHADVWLDVVNEKESVPDEHHHP